MKLEAFVVTYRRDLHWLCYSAQLLFKHFKADFNLHVVAEPDCEEVLKTWGLPSTTYHYVKPWPDGYAFAMYQKSIADTYCPDADLIFIFDSDHMLLGPTNLGNFMKDDKPIIRYREWNEDPNDNSLSEGKRQWGPPTYRVLGMPLDRDYMRGPPFLFWRETFKGLRNRVEEVTGLPFHDAVYSDRPYDYRSFLTHPKVYCDYESLGLFAAKFEPGHYHIAHDSKYEYWPFRVYWSHGDWNQHLQNQLDAMLARDEPYNGDPYVDPQIAALVSKHMVQTIIETGTYKGSTSKALANWAPVVTIELDSVLFNETASMKNVTQFGGDSAELLPKILTGVKEPVLFYLDAHWGNHSPLLDELKAIRGCKRPVIVIHDFKNPDRPDFGYDSWDVGPYDYELIQPLLHEIYPDGYTHRYNQKAAGQRRGIIFIEPRP